MAGMTGISLSFCPITVDDVDASIAFYRDALGLEVTNDVASDGHRWVTLGRPGPTSTALVLSDPAAEVLQEPMQQPWGVRDCAFRDPAGNHIRVNETRK